ncbi:MAG: hypothetical protein WC121_03605 [Candidatus Kapaibacterium sp.]
MNREIVNNILQKIEETNTLLFEEESEIKFCKIYEGILFKTVIPHKGEQVGLYKLTLQGKSVLNSSRNQ